MKKLNLLIIGLICSIIVANGQIINGSGFEKYRNQRKTNDSINKIIQSSALIAGTVTIKKKEKEYVTDPIIGTTYNISMSTFTIPISFNRIEIKDGAYSLGSPLNIGAGYTWIIGKAVYNQDKTLQVQPGLFFGLGLDTGVKPNGDNLQGTLSGNVFVGFSKVALSFGYDIVNKNIFFGLGTRIDIFSFFNNDLYTVNRLWSNPIPRVQTTP